MTKKNSFIVVEKSLNIIWGFGQNAITAEKDAMRNLHDAAPDCDEFTDFMIFQTSKTYESLKLIQITADAVKMASSEPNGELGIWVENNKGICLCDNEKLICTYQELETYYKGRD